ncbi:MAG: hypothetical protein CBB79_03845 [Synechococcus sp. TMED19]|nr:MAG: hypothetical protein CBB79_03845 [Synechococcus sp. TMED19]
MRQRVVVLKGAEGFADRTQCLMQAVSYASKTGRTLVVDWRDEDWSHDPSEPLSDYLSIEGHDTLPIADFLEQLKNDPSPRSVFPEAWSDHLFTDQFNAFMRDGPFKLPENGACLEQIVKGNRADFDADLVIYPGVGERVYQYSILKQVKLSPWIASGIKDFAKARQISEAKFDLVHLRGGSKAWMGGFVSDRSPVKAEHNQWPSAEEYMKPIWEVYQHLVSTVSEKCPLFVMSDTPQLIKLWQQTYQCGNTIPNLVQGQLSESGIHKLRSNDIETPKRDINFECLRDFTLMLNSRILVGDGVSLFSLMALHCKTSGARMVNL